MDKVPVIVPSWSATSPLRYRVFMVDPGELGTFLPPDSAVEANSFGLIHGWIEYQLIKRKARRDE